MRNGKLVAVVMLAERLLQDLSHTVRTLRRSPAFTVAAVVTLALGIGASTAIFSVVNAVVLKPLPFGDPARLMRIYESNPERGWEEYSVSDPNFLDWQARSTSWDALAAFDSGTVSLSMGPGVEIIPALRVSSEFLSALGFRPSLGRGFRPEETRPGGDPNVTIISDGLWRRLFDADPAVIGTTVRINDSPHTIIGVLPRQFGWEGAELLRPRVLDPNRSRGDHQLNVIGLRAPNVPIDQARAELATIASQLAEEYPADDEGWTVRLLTFRDWLLPTPVRDSLVVLQVAVLLVLLIACMNVANLLFARGMTRQKEIAIRVAMGASRSRIVRRGLMESLVLAFIGAVAGVGLAAAAIRTIAVYAAAVVPRIDEATTDWPVLGFAFVCALASAAAFGLLPALYASGEQGGGLYEASRGTTGGRSRQRIRTWLTVAEVSLSVALLIGAGLLLRSFITLQQVDIGFDVDAVMTGRVMPASATEFDTPQKRREFWTRLNAEVSAIPGVTAVSTSSSIPLGAVNTSTEITVPGATLQQGVEPSADWRVVMPGYFAAMGIPLRGRDFSEADGPDSPPVIIVSEGLARELWPNEDAIGKSIIPSSLGNRERTVVGVVGDVRSSGLDGDLKPAIYYSGVELPVFAQMYLVWRSALDPRSQIPAIRDAIRRLSPQVAFYDVLPASEMLSDSFRARRFNLYLLGLFAAVAVALAVIGLFSVMVYLVSQRTREIGVRFALGATPASVFRTVLGRGTVLATAGAVIGVVLAVWLTRLMEGLLFSVSRTDPIILTVVPVSMVAVAVLASYVPARRAMRVDPMVALRVE